MTVASLLHIFLFCEKCGRIRLQLALNRLVTILRAKVLTRIFVFMRGKFEDTQTTTLNNSLEAL
jgi:hypothetical protein